MWLRGRFTLEDPSAYYGIALGRILFSDRTYINGHLVGSMSRRDISMLPSPRHYVIASEYFPGGILRKGNNELYVRLGIYGNEYGGILNPVTLMEEDDFCNDRLVSNFLFYQLPIGFALLFTCNSLALLIAFCFLYKEKILLYTSLASSMIILHVVLNYLPLRYINPELCILYERAAVPILGIVLFYMIQGIYKIYFSEYNRILIPLLLLFAVLIIFFSNILKEFDVGRILQIASFIVLLIYSLFLVNRLRSLHRDAFLFRIFVTMGGIMGVLLPVEIYFGITGGFFSDLLLIFVIPLFVPFFGVIWARDYMNRTMEIKGLYGQLKTMQDKNRGVSITESSEDKLKRIVAFLDENYISDISREGLAAAVSMNANYMGRLFREYTGMKINEYINKKRIEYAMERLADGTTRIIDIALSAGFESVTTFNRIFKDYTGTTPRDFREQK